jgi:hypothetical protein
MLTRSMAVFGLGVEASPDFGRFEGTGEGLGKLKGAGDDVGAFVGTSVDVGVCDEVGMNDTPVGMPLK